MYMLQPKLNLVDTKYKINGLPTPDIPVFLTLVVVNFALFLYCKIFYYINYSFSFDIRLLFKCYMNKMNKMISFHFCTFVRLQ